MKDNRKFKEVVTGIKESEKDVDKVLKAARLDRHEQKRHRLDFEDLIPVFFFITLWLVIILMFLCA